MDHAYPVGSPRMTLDSLHSDELLAQWRAAQQLARQLIGLPDIAEDVAQEALVSAWQLRRPPDSLAAWLVVAARRLALRARGRTRSRAAIEGAAGSLAAARRRISESEHLALHSRLQAAVADLPQPYRTVVTLRFFDDLPPRTIARRQRCSSEVVRQQLHRGLEMLRSRLHAEFGDRSWRSAAPIGSAVALRGKGLVAVQFTLMKSLPAFLGLLAVLLVGGAWLLDSTPLPSPGSAATGIAASSATPLATVPGNGEAMDRRTAILDPTPTEPEVRTTAEDRPGLGSLRIRVLRRGEPEAGATVTAVSTTGGRVVAEGRSDPRGEVHLPALLSERYLITAVATDAVEARILGDVFMGGTNTATLELSTASRLRVVAIDPATRSPIAGATVGCWMEVPIQGSCLGYTPLHAESSPRRTDAAGVVVFDGLLAGSTLRAVASDGPALPTHLYPGAGESVVIQQPMQELRLCVQPRQVLLFPLADSHEVTPPRDCDLAVTDLAGTQLGTARIVGERLEARISGPTATAQWVVRGPDCIAQANTYDSAEVGPQAPLAGPPVRFVRPRTCALILRDPRSQPIAGAAVEVYSEASYTLGFRRGRSDALGTVTWHDLPDTMVALRLADTAEPWPLASVDLTRGDGRTEVLLPTPQAVRADVTVDGQRGLPADASLRCKNGVVTRLEPDATRGTLTFEVLWRDPTQPIELELGCFGGWVATTATLEPRQGPAAVAFHLRQCAVATARVIPPADGWLELCLERRSEGNQWHVWSQVVPGRHGSVLPPFTNLTPGCYRLRDLASDSHGPAVEIGTGQQVALDLDLASVVVASGRVVNLDDHELDGIAIVVSDERGQELRHQRPGRDGRFSLRIATRGGGLFLAAVHESRRSAALPLTGPLSDVVLALPSR